MQRSIIKDFYKIFNEDFRRIVIKIIGFDGNSENVIKKYVSAILFFIPSLRNQPVNRRECFYGQTVTDLKSLIGIISSMKDMSTRDINVANNFFDELCNHNDEIPKMLRVNILIFLHFVLLQCQQLDEVIEEKAVSVVVCSIEEIFISLDS